MLNVDGIALVKNAHPHPKRKKLVQYLTSRSVQQRLVAEFDAKSIRKMLVNKAISLSKILRTYL